MTPRCYLDTPIFTVKAWFEEAKFRDLSITSVSSRVPRVAGRMNNQSNVESNRRPVRASLDPISIKRDKKEVNFRCFTCNGVGHSRKDCLLKNRSAPVEARGQQAPRNTTAGKVTAALQKTSEAI